MWRSETMSYMRLIIPIEAAHSFVDEIGRRGVMQFVDLNTQQQAFQRRYVRSITMINDIKRLTGAITGFLDTYDVPYKEDKNFIDSTPITPALLDKTCIAIRELHQRLTNDFTVAKEFKDQLAREQELEYVLDRSQQLLSRDSAQAQALFRGVDDGRQQLLGDIESGPEPVAFRFIAGIVTKAQRLGFERQVFLASRGNAYCIFMDVESPEKQAFVVFFLGTVLERRLTKLCQVMNINIYLHPENQGTIHARLTDCRQRQTELRETLFKTESRLKHDLFGVSSEIGTWNRILLQCQCIYSILNFFRINEAAQMVQAEGWVPTAYQQIVRDALRAALTSKGFSSSNNPSVVQAVEKDFSVEMPPTSIRTNKFTSVFQAIVDTYGVPRYGEINPGVLTIMTFPFLFGVMYGDVFHGTLLFLFSLWMILNEKKLQSGPMNEFFEAAFKGRYILVFMGFFALYCGLIYNDFTSIPLRLFTTRYNEETHEFDGVYAFGVDYSWYGSDLELAFLNSLKMKMAIVFGVTHMVVGVFLSLVNQLHEKDYLGIVCEFVPRILFMLSFFGYMVFIILYKWCIDWGKFGTHRAPSLIVTLINMVLNFGKVGSEADKNDPDPPIPLFDGQEGLQKGLLIIALLCVPWMLLLKPVALWFYHKYRLHEAEAYRPLAADVDLQLEHPKPQEHHEYDFAESFVHQMIHTIEYVLGCVSNTASYLRLWALSLAHAQLASVFYNKLIAGNYDNPITLFIGFYFFLNATFGVLMGMDVLECFLHALRLHWVEFMNKFYNADGISFRPLFYLNLNKED